MTQTGIFNGRVLVPYAYGCYGYTRGGGKTWHGGIDLVGPDDTTIRMPWYTAPDGSRKAITGKVITARIVTDQRRQLSVFLPLRAAAGPGGPDGHQRPGAGHHGQLRQRSAELAAL